jgi:circadian clock protein KaiB
MNQAPSLSLCLYVAGTSPKSILALSNLKKICEQHIPVKYELEVVDMTEDPSQAVGYQIQVLPTLVRKHPMPVKKVVGDLSNVQEVLLEIGVQPNGHLADKK